MQLDMQSKRIFNVFPLVQIQHAVHCETLRRSFAIDGAATCWLLASLKITYRTLRRIRKREVLIFQTMLEA